MPSLGVRKSRGNTEPLQINLNFRPFSAYFVPFCPVVGSSGPQVLRLPRESMQGRGREAQHHPTKRGTQQDQPPRWCQPIGNGAHEDKGNATRERAGAIEERKKEGSPQAHKPTKRGTPPYCKGQAAVPLITNSRQKISKKSPWVVLKKFSEKFFVGMFRGKEKPLAFLNGRGVAITNREISNLAMQVTKNAQKHYLITEYKGR